jgi:hypothetical protein
VAAGTAADPMRVVIDTMIVRQIAAILLLLSTVDADGRAYAGSWGIEFDNDRFVDTDRHYTHGTRLFWLSDAGDTPDWAQRLAVALPRIDGPGALRLGAVIGQDMFTPDDISDADIVADDRPYAGWLYGGLALTRATARNQRRWEIDIGIVGPASLARQTQIVAHDVLGTAVPRGWANQLRNEPGFVLIYEEMWQRVWSLDTDGTRFALAPHIAGSLGNVYTYAAAGGSLRFGTFARDEFGPARIRPGVPGSDRVVADDGFAWTLFAGAEARLVARNIFLDGNTFTDSHSVDKRPLVLDLQVGVSLDLDGVRLTAMQVFRTREFEHQATADRFGVVEAAFRF